MAFEAPRLDDRTYRDIYQEALQRIPTYCPEWTDYNLSDPGITLIELFAWMTDIMLYRMNRIPEKHYIKLMELLGMRLYEAEAAQAEITFWLVAPQLDAVVIPEGTSVSTVRTETEPMVTFTTDAHAEIRVPILSTILTRSQDIADLYEDINRRDLMEGVTDKPIFGSTPRPLADDALYIGFANDLSKHILELKLDLSTAEGAGIDPRNPPYVWEVETFDEDERWKPLEIEDDTTAGLNKTGRVIMHLPTMRKSVRGRKGIEAYWIRCRLREGDDDIRSYEISPRIRQLAVNTWGVTVNASNVTRVENEILGRSDGTPGQRFYLEHTPIATRVDGENLYVRHNDGKEVAWREVADFANSEEDDRHYTLDSTTGEIRLPPAIPLRDGEIQRFGSVVERNAMLIMRSYRHGGGSIRYIASNTLTVLKTALPYVDRVLNRRPATGGKDTESLAAAKMRLPNHLRSLGRAVTTEDFEYLAYEAAPAQVNRVRCLQNPDIPGEIRLLVIPHVPQKQMPIAPASLQISNQLETQLYNYLDERRLLCTRLVINEPQYIWLETRVRVHPSIGFSEEDVRTAARQYLFNYFTPLRPDGQEKRGKTPPVNYLNGNMHQNGNGNGKVDGGWRFGQAVYKAHVIQALLTVPEVDFVRDVQLFEANQLSPDRIVSTSEPLEEVMVPPDGVIVSYQHTIIIE